MLKHIKTLAGFLAIGFVLAVGMRAAEYVFVRPPVKLLICMSDNTGAVGACKDFEEFTKNKNEPDQ